MNDTRQETARSFLSPLFLASAVLLAAVAVALRPALAALIRQYSKESIAIRHPLPDFDVSGLPSFRPLPEGVGAFPLGLYDDIGTEEILRANFEQRGPETEGHRDLDVLLFVTYYSDPRDQIPHTPDVCYRSFGATVTNITTTPIETELFGPDVSRIDLRQLDMTLGGWRQVLLYGFVSNGKFYHDRERLRLAIGTPGDRYIYFSKIETVTGVPPGTDFDVAVDRCKLMLSEVLPILMEEYFPTDQDLHRR